MQDKSKQWELELCKGAESLSAARLRVHLLYNPSVRNQNKTKKENISAV